MQPSSTSGIKAAVNMSKPWFTTQRIDDDTFVISEERHPEQTHCYLLNGSSRSLLIDTGMGIADIKPIVTELAVHPVTAVPTHVHWDHIGGLWNFPDFYVHEEELSWISDGFPLPLAMIRSYVGDCDDLPCGFNVDSYRIFQGMPTKVLRGDGIIDLGSRTIEVLHTPGHSPGHMCFWEPDRGYLYTGDLVYLGELYAFYPSTDPQAYLSSIKKLVDLPVCRLFPGHRSLDIDPRIIESIQEELSKLDKAGKLAHSEMHYDFGDWSISL